MRLGQGRPRLVSNNRLVRRQLLDVALDLLASSHAQVGNLLLDGNTVSASAGDNVNVAKITNANGVIIVAYNATKFVSECINLVGMRLVRFTKFGAVLYFFFCHRRRTRQ